MNTETTVKRLNGLNSKIGTAIEFCGTCKKRADLINSLSSISGDITKTLNWLKENQKRRFTGTRKSLTAVSNVVEGMIEGLRNDMTRAEFKAVLRNLEGKFYPQISTSFHQELEQVDSSAEATVALSEDQEQVKQEIAQSGDWKDALAVIKKAIVQKPAVQDSAKNDVDPSATQFAELKQSREKLPVRVKGEFQVVRMPIVPIFSNYQLNSEVTFKKLGIKHLPVEGYAVLLDQVLVCVSELKAKKHKLTTLQFAESVIALLNERGTIDYELVTDQPAVNPRNADILMYWVLPRPKLNALMRISRDQRNASSVKWGLPF